MIFSPNTPGLRSLQNKEELSRLLSEINKTLNSLQIENKPPLLLKLAPDLSVEEIKDIIAVINKKDCKVDGLIISNTTIERPALKNQEYCLEIGGLSGKPLTNKSTEMIKTVYKLTKGIFRFLLFDELYTVYLLYWYFNSKFKNSWHM